VTPCRTWTVLVLCAFLCAGLTSCRSRPETNEVLPSLLNEKAVATLAESGWTRIPYEGWEAYRQVNWEKAARGAEESVNQEGHQPWRRTPEYVAASHMWNFHLKNAPRDVFDFAPRLKVIQDGHIYGYTESGLEYRVLLKWYKGIPEPYETYVRTVNLENASFPLTRGNYWVYKGQTKWTVANSNQVKEAALTWKMQVAETFATEAGTVAVIKGHPSDLAWYEEGKAPSDSLIVQAKGGRFHRIEGDQRQEVLAAVKAGKPIPAGTLSEETVFLQLPLRRGAGFGNMTDRPIEPGFYSWAVEQVSPAKLSSIKGAPPGDGRRQYRLVLRTNPDHQEMDFVPGVGIVRYQYVHHGTVAETDLHLVECHLADASLGAPLPEPRRSRNTVNPSR